MLVFMYSACVFLQRSSPEAALVIAYCRCVAAHSIYSMCIIQKVYISEHAGNARLGPRPRSQKLRINVRTPRRPRFQSFGTSSSTSHPLPAHVSTLSLGSRGSRGSLPRTAIHLPRAALKRLDHLISDLGEDGLRRDTMQRVGEREHEVDSQKRGADGRLAGQSRGCGLEGPCRDEVLE